MAWSGLLDFNLIPNEMISGMEESEIQKMIDEFQLPENNNGYTNGLPNGIREEMDKMELEEVTESSKIHIKQYVKKFKHFLTEKNLSQDIEAMDESLLGDYLRFFYSSLRKQDGGYYSPSSLGCIRAAIHRYLISAPVSRNVNIINGSAFVSTNKMLKAFASKYIKMVDKKKDLTRLKKKTWSN